MDTLWESSEEKHCLSNPFPLSVPIVSSHSNRDMSMQTEEALGLSLDFKAVTSSYTGQCSARMELVLKLESLTKNYEDQWSRMVQKQEVQQTMIDEQVDTTFKEVLSQMSQADLVRLLPWFLSVTASSHAGPTHSVSEALTTIVQWMPDAPTDGTTPKF